MINFVSNLPADLRSGGFSAMNVAALEALKKQHEVHYVGPIDPPAELWRRATSKLARTVGARGSFFAFSRRRLAAISVETTERCRGEALVDFFHGFTPWIAMRPSRPYVAWSDCTFRDYVGIYHDRAIFRVADLARIEAAEAAWLQRAKRIAFTSNWAAKRAVQDYCLDSTRVSVVGIFGEVEAPEADAYNGAEYFAFVSTNFRAKGGQVVLEALSRLRTRHPRAELVIVGDAPADVIRQPGVSAVGFLRKEDPVDNARLRKILGEARAVVHPTRSDIAPLVVVEAGYFGCPVISTSAFAIPEILARGETGLLLDDPSNSEAVANCMAWMLEAHDQYAKMRRAAWKKARGELSKACFETRLQDFLGEALAEIAH